MAKANAVTNYPITFQATNCGEVASALLYLTNNYTTQKFVYNLRGVAEEPLPEETLTVQAQAREVAKKKLMLKNQGGDKQGDYLLEVTCESPLVNCWVQSDRTGSMTAIHMEPGKSVVVDVCFRAFASGQYSAALTLKSKLDHTLVSWYSFDVVVKKPPAESRLNVSTVAREPIVVAIPLANPKDEDIFFDVSYQGHGLKGASRLQVSARSEKTYELTYCPGMLAIEKMTAGQLNSVVLAQKSMGSIRFTNDTIGEFWYELDLEALEAPPVSLPDMQAVLGQCSVCLFGWTGIGFGFILSTFHFHFPGGFSCAR